MTNHLVEMKRLSLESLDAIVRTSATCLSIYLPAYQRGTSVPRSDVLLRSLLDVAESKLVAREVAASDIEDLLRPLVELARDECLQRGHAESLAIFRAPNRFEVFVLPLPVKESVTVGASFYIIPALEQLSIPSDYWVLALSRKGVRLLHGTSTEIKEVKLPAAIPATLEDFLAFAQPDRRENRSSSGPSTGGRKAVSFGTGVDAECHDRYFRNYCLAIDSGLRAMLGVKPQPLVLMGAAKEVGIYRSVSEHYYVTDPILRSPDDGAMPDEEIPHRVRMILAQLPSPPEQHAYEVTEKVMGTALSVDNLAGILRFAHKGRVDTVFLCQGATEKGDIDHITGQVRLSGEYQASDDDLYNAVAIETLRHSGHVWVVPQMRIPGEEMVLARLRY